MEFYDMGYLVAAYMGFYTLLHPTWNTGYDLSRHHHHKRHAPPNEKETHTTLSLILSQVLLTPLQLLRHCNV